MRNIKGLFLSFTNKIFIQLLITALFSFTANADIITDYFTNAQFSNTDNLGHIALSLSGSAIKVFGNATGGAVLGTGTTFDSQFINSAFVMKEENIYKMWYSGVSNNQGRLGYAESINGIDWTKIDGSGSGGCILDIGGFASRSIGVCTVITDNNIYKMWYSGDDSINNRIGYAESTNGIDWTKISGSGTGGSVFDVGGGFDNLHVHCPAVIKENNIYKMWYSGQASAGLAQIGYAVSSNGIDWVRQNNGNSVMAASGSGFEGNNIQYSRVVKDGNLIRQFYTGEAIASFNFRIGYAYSYNGTNWTKITGDGTGGCILDLNGTTSFDTVDVAYPCVIKDDNTYRMWYNGYASISTNSTNSGIGYAYIPYKTSGNIISKTFDSGNPDTVWTNLSWNEILPAGTDIQFQLAANNDNSTWNFIGPDGTEGTVYNNSSGESIGTDLTNKRYLQYKAYLSTTVNTQTPSLNSVTIKYGINDSNPPNPITSFKAWPSDGVVNLSWSKPTNSDFAGVKVMRTTGAWSVDENNGTEVYNGTATNYIDNTAANGTTYFYSIYAYDTANNYSQATQTRINRGFAQPAAENGEMMMDSDTVALWHFNGDANDLSPNGNNGTNHGANWLQGAFNQSAWFSENEYIAISHHESLVPINNEVTVEAWIYLTNIPPIDMYNIIFSKHRDSNWEGDYVLQMEKNLDNMYPQFVINNGSTLYNVKATNFINLNQWYYITGTYNGTNICIYINGELDNKKQVITTLNMGNASPCFAKQAGPDMNYDFLGTIDEARISSVARSSQEIAQYWAMASNKSSALSYTSWGD